MDEEDQHAEAQHRECDAHGHRQMRHELFVVASSDGAEHQEAIDEGWDECAEYDLVAQVAQEVPQ